MSIRSVFFSFLSKIFISFNSLYVQKRKTGEIKKKMEKMKKTREKENSACVYDNCYMTIVISHFLKSINVAFYNQKVEKKPCD